MNRLLILIILFTFIILSSCQMGKKLTTITTNIVTTTEVGKEPLFTSLTILNKQLKAYEKIEMRLNAKVDIKSLVNPYDYDSLNIFGEFTSPLGKKLLYQLFGIKNMKSSWMKIGRVQEVMYQ